MSCSRRPMVDSTKDSGPQILKAAKALVDDLHAALKLKSAGNENEA